jgi:hypothetical protein
MHMVCINAAVITCTKGVAYSNLPPGTVAS